MSEKLQMKNIEKLQKKKVGNFQKMTFSCQVYRPGDYSNHSLAQSMSFKKYYCMITYSDLQ